MAKPIGIDFDNTIVCYDTIFHRVCVERGLSPAGLAVNKTSVRDYLRSIGQEDAWTEIQGHVYGTRMSEVEAYPGFLDFLRAARRAGREVFVISHKTRFPFKGAPHDLHAAALNWLEANHFFSTRTGPLRRANVFLELTKEAKWERIGQCACGAFIDDLPEFLLHPSFPKGVAPVLFDPNDLHPERPGILRMKHWSEAKRLLL